MPYLNSCQLFISRIIIPQGEEKTHNEKTESEMKLSVMWLLSWSLKVIVELGSWGCRGKGRRIVWLRGAAEGACLFWGLIFSSTEAYIGSHMLRVHAFHRIPGWWSQETPLRAGGPCVANWLFVAVTQWLIGQLRYTSVIAPLVVSVQAQDEEWCHEMDASQSNPLNFTRDETDPRGASTEGHCHWLWDSPKGPQVFLMHRDVPWTWRVQSRRVNEILKFQVVLILTVGKSTT